MVVASVLKVKRGFSLIELLIVLAIVATLVSVITPLTINAIRAAKATKIAYNFKAFYRSIINKVYIDNEVPASIIELGRNVDLEKYGVAWKEADGYYEFVVFTSEDVDISTLQEKLPNVSGEAPSGEYNFIDGGKSSFDGMTACYTFLLDKLGNSVTTSSDTGGSGSDTSSDPYTLAAFPEFPTGIAQAQDRYVEMWGSRWYWVKDGILRTDWTPTEEYIIDSDGYYSRIEVVGDRELVIDTGTAGTVRKIIVDVLDIQQGKITLTGNGTAEIYVTNSFSIAGSSQVNFGGNPERLKIYYKGSGTVAFGGDIYFTGTFYSRYADVTFGGAAHFKGLLASRGSNVYVAGGASLSAIGGSVQNSIAINAPYANVVITEGGSVNGTVIGSSVTVSGGGFASNIIETNN